MFFCFYSAFGSSFAGAVFFLKIDLLRKMLRPPNTMPQTRSKMPPKYALIAQMNVMPSVIKTTQSTQRATKLIKRLVFMAATFSFFFGFAGFVSGAIILGGSVIF